MTEEEPSVPYLAVSELSTYHAPNEIEESTFLAMGVPQGPGNALQFLSYDEPSTCFTPNFEEARTVNYSEVDRLPIGQASRTVNTVDFEFSSSSMMTEEGEAARVETGSSVIVATTRINSHLTLHINSINIVYNNVGECM